MLPLVQLASLEALGSQAIDDERNREDAVDHQQTKPGVAGLAGDADAGHERP